MKTKNVFCSNCQEVKEHEVAVLNGDFVFTCDCERFIKLPTSLSKEEITKALAKHHEVNEGQLTLEAIEEENSALLEKI